MIVNRERTTVLSSIGWVDGDAIWCLDTASGMPRTIPLHTGARYSTLHGSDTERFVTVHHFDGAKFQATVGLLSTPESTLSSAGFENGRASLTGNTDAWIGLPRLFVEYLAQPWNDHVLINVAPEGVTVQRLEWYGSSYDKGYQGVIDVIALPDPRYALISVQRSSELVLHDLETGQASRKISLGTRQGNPRLTLRRSGKEVWATDYDTLVSVDTGSWSVRRTKRLQGAISGTRQFIGDYSFSADGGCCVARPYSGDVVVVDERLSMRRKARLGRQPHEAIELPNGDVIARDWKTGDLLRGQMQQIGWLGRLFQ